MPNAMKYLPSIIFIILLVAISVGSTVYTDSGQIGKDIVFNQVVKDFPVTFSHKSHVKDHEQRCAECHPKLFPMVKSDIKIMMADFKEGKVCGACHLGGRAFGPASNCTLCHDILSAEVITYQGKIAFSHSSHVKERKAECDVCHDNLFRTEVSQPPYMSAEELQELFDQGKLCGSCHDGEKAFKHYIF